MTNKYEARIFPNGRVVLYKRKDLEDAIKAGKELLIVCNCLYGGYALAIGADVTTDWYEPDKTAWMMYSYDVFDREFTGGEMAKFHKVIFTEGERIYNKEGDYATSYFPWRNCFQKNGVNMKVSEEITARFLSREEVEAMIEIGVLTEKALKYCKGN